MRTRHPSAKLCHPSTFLRWSVNVVCHPGTTTATPATFTQIQRPSTTTWKKKQSSSSQNPQVYSCCSLWPFADRPPETSLIPNWIPQLEPIGLWISPRYATHRFRINRWLLIYRSDVIELAEIPNHIKGIILTHLSWLLLWRGFFLLFGDGCVSMLYTFCD